jgi:drug/metabolite transporter (DMT)-like permease
MIIVGSSVVFGKIITHSFPVFLASGLRFAIASLMMLPILFFREKPGAKIDRKALINLVLMAFCGQFVFTFLVLLGLRYTSAIEAGIITSTSPGMMVIVTFILFREKPRMLHILAVVMVVAGVILVNGFLCFDGVMINARHMVGNALMLGAVVGEAFFLLMRKRISSDITNMTLTAYLCFLGWFMFMPLSIYQALSFDFASVSMTAWWAMLYFGAVFTVFAYLFWFKGVSKVSGSTAGIFTALMPISAIILSCIFLDESFGIHHGVGGGLIILAILILAVNSSDEKQDTILTVNPDQG